jgi:dimeric dUTPase (all-alpha-NTP-PPase superfamily)
MNLPDAKKIKSAAMKLRKSHPFISYELEEIIARNYTAAPTLQDVFDAQIKFNEKAVPGLYDIIAANPNELDLWLIRFDLAMRQEMAELIDSLHWKWWKKQETDIGNVKVELVDILHFWVSMCTVVGLDAKSVMDLYFKKNKLNHKRQDGGYKEGTYSKYIDGVEDNVREITNAE